VAYFDIRNEQFTKTSVDGTATFYQDFSRTWLILGEFIWFTQMVGLQNKTTRERRLQNFIEIKIVSLVHYFY